MLHEFDHRVLGEKYDLFSFFAEGPGLPVWHEYGLRIKHALIDYWRELHRENGYQEIQSPILLDKELWQRSGHCDYFEENMFFSSVDKRDYAVKPMNCPGAILRYKQKKRSHAELPMRLSEMGHVHRNENSGSLHGLMRARSFVQDDAHIFCRSEQLVPEIKSVLRLIEQIMAQCGLREYHFELSLRGGGKEFLGEDEEWVKAEQCLEQALAEMGLSALKNPGEAKFYGPSLDLHFQDAHGRSWQLSSIQLDFNLPARFALRYFDEQGAEQVPFMLHRAIFGSLERFIGILLEHYGKELPYWLHPVSCKVLSVSSDANAYALAIVEDLRVRGINAEADIGNDPLKEKIRRAHLSMARSLVVVGLKEVGERGVVLREGAQNRPISLERFLSEVTNR